LPPWAWFERIKAMKQLLRSSILLLSAMIILTGFIYPLAVTGISQALFSYRANGSLIAVAGRTPGSALVGQPFSGPRYFWGRPSATAPFPYNSAASTGSNRGPSNPEFLKQVRGRMKTLQDADPQNRLPVPVDLVAASGSGLDPHISPAAAFYQVRRVAEARGVHEETVRRLVEDSIEGRTLGLMGEPVVNVLLLNMALDNLR
jgi:K+-transporting ATPase ATPase C chain